ncbi:MAG: CRISPR-associated endonuclease Cas2 [bacterium]|nr:CRISPR-associated endonuclease Cas2 [bacterium]
MRLPLTEKFLWQFYTILENADQTYKLLTPRPMRAVLSPEWYKLKKTYEQEKSKKTFSQFVHYLKVHGYIKPTESGEGVLLTAKGRNKALKIKLKLIQEKPRRDGRFVMAFFDIPEAKRKTRDIFREFLVTMGYKKLQQSVWMCGNDALEETERIVREYALERCVKLFLIKAVEL